MLASIHTAVIQSSFSVALLAGLTGAAEADTRFVVGGVPEQPSSLGLIEDTLRFSGSVGEIPTKDAWFSFETSRDAEIEIEFDRPGITFDLREPGSRGMDGVLASTAFSQEMEIRYEGGAGAYLLRAYADEPSDYEITISIR